MHAMQSRVFARRRLLQGGIGAVLASIIAAPARGASSSVLVELFTSQGCSSCPPADAYLAEFSHEPGIIALAYHVDYWDNLGWQDLFSNRAATARQRAYARLLALSAVYTPQIVVNGRFDVVGSDRKGVAAAITKAAATAPAAAVSLLAENALIIQVAAGTGEGRVWSVVYDLRHDTDVRRGENAGRRLANVNIVRSIEALDAWSGAALTVTRELPPPGSGAAVFVQASNGAILGAAAFNN